MKILLYTDNHFSQYSSVVRSRGKKYSTRLENQIQSLNWVEELAKEKQCEKVICLGDFFDKPDLNSEELTALKDINWNKEIPHYFIVGNHEMGSQDLTYNSANALKEIGKVITKPDVISIYGCDIILLPYILESNRKPLKDYIKELYAGTMSTCEVKNTIILSHNDLKGIRYGQYESKMGFDINEIEEECTMYINGHLHNQQQVTKKILNLGNLTGQNFSEDASKYSHCAGILDTNTATIELINNPYAFNFYKLEVNSILELDNKLNQIDNNAVISLKIPLSLVGEAKQKLLSNPKIKESRIISIPEIKDNKVIQNELTKMDHIEQFKQYILSNLEYSEILIEELNLL